jgi:hypothetical protein
MKLSTTSLALLILLAASRTYHQKQKKKEFNNGGKKPLYTKYIQGVSRIVTTMGRRYGIISKLDYIKKPRY